MSEPRVPPDQHPVPFFPIARDGSHGLQRPVTPDGRSGQINQGAKHPTRPAVVRSTPSNYIVEFGEVFNRPQASQQQGDTVRQLQDRVGRGATTTSPSFTTQLTDIGNMPRPIQRPFAVGRSTFPMRPSFELLRNITPAGDFRIHVEKRTARQNINPAVWEIDDGLKAAWRAHLDGERKG
ncbi:hypothetical protein BR93DRAFT_938278 [Coniochaeta sp. PMI_546]|nr:hypothetical protein BR93DRAFT_938278 [Coniochaeta sp. PMI_546]